MSLLNIARPGQPWLPGSSFDPAGSRAADNYLNSINWWQRPAVNYNSPSFNPFAAQTLVPPAGATASSPSSNGPFTAETLVKNPELAAILKKLYGDIGNISTDPNVNQTVLQRNVKLPEVEAAGQAELKQAVADATNNRQSIADFAKNFMAEQPAALARANTEATNLGRIQSGALAADLEANQRSSDINSTQNLMRRLGVLAGSRNLGDLSRGGVSNSFADARVLQAAAEAQLARDAAALAGRRQNIMDVTNLQTSTAGLSQKILDAVLQRALTPVQAGQASSAADLSRLAGTSGLLTNNSVFTPQSQSSMIQQIQQLLGGQANLDPAANYRYVKGNFPTGMPGVVPQQYPNFPNPAAGNVNQPAMTLQDMIAAIQQSGMMNQPTLTATTPSNTSPPSAYTGTWDWQKDRTLRQLAETGGWSPSQDTETVPIWNRDFRLSPSQDTETVPNWPSFSQFENL